MRVTVATVGTAAAEPMLRDALARGADSAIRIEPPRGPVAGMPGTSPGPVADAPGMPRALAAVAGVLAAVLAGCEVVLCGDGGQDGGSGALPALLAAHSSRAQALGLMSVEAAAEPGTVRAERRLDRGWRERLLVRAPMVLSVESGVARPRRAPMAAVLAAADAAISVLPWAAAGGGTAHKGSGGALVHEGSGGALAPEGSGEPATPMTVLPYRPRARVLRPPEGRSPFARVLSLLGTDRQREPPERVDAEPAAAAQQILDKLRGWGYL